MRSPLCRQRPQGASNDLEVRAVFLRPARPSVPMTTVTVAEFYFTHITTP